MSGRHRDPDLIVEVGRTLDPFKHEEQRARDLFAKHHHPEEFLEEKHASQLKNFNQLKELGLHPLLARQTNERPPPEWVHCQIRAKGTEHWITFFMRKDNLYVRGFANQHQGYEISEAAVDKETGRSVRSILLPIDYGCILLDDWDVRYSVLFGKKNRDELELDLQQIIKDPNFAFDAVCYLSSYVHIAEDKVGEAKAKRLLGGTIFLACESWRMNISKLPGRLVFKAQHWGDICIELLKWRDRGFKDWISKRVFKENEEPSKLYQALKEMNILSEKDCLILIYLVLNRPEEYYENVSSNKGGKKGEKSSGSGSGSGSGIKKLDSSRSAGTHGRRQHGKSFTLEATRLGLGDLLKDGDPLPWGRWRVQLLNLTANFEIDWIDFHDWHRSQAIYRRSLAHGGYPHLELVGPARAIGAYGCIGVEFCPSNTSRKGEIANPRHLTPRGSMMELWGVSKFNDLEPTVHTKEVAGPWDHQKITIRYMLIPDTVEVRIRVRLFLAGEGRYQVSGKIMACHSAMSGNNVKIFGKRPGPVVVLAGRWAEFPLVAPLFCLPNDGKVDFKIAAYLNLKESRSDSGDGAEQDIEVSQSDCLTFSERVKKQVREVGGHKIAVTVTMET